MKQGAAAVAIVLKVQYISYYYQVVSKGLSKRCLLVATTLVFLFLLSPLLMRISISKYK